MLLEIAEGLFFYCHVVFLLWRMSYPLCCIHALYLLKGIFFYHTHTHTEKSNRETLEIFFNLRAATEFRHEKLNLILNH